MGRSTRVSNLRYIRRTIKPALGSTQVRGPLLDTLYARLMRCGNLACTGKPFTQQLGFRTLDRRLLWLLAHPIEHLRYVHSVAGKLTWVPLPGIVAVHRLAANDGSFGQVEPSDGSLRVCQYLTHATAMEEGAALQAASCVSVAKGAIWTGCPGIALVLLGHKVTSGF
jgi:hypothetical protein